MSCASRTYTSPAFVPTPTRIGTYRPSLLTAIIAAFQEALAMRRVAHSRYFLSDE